MPTAPMQDPKPARDVTGYPMDEDRERIRKALTDQAPVWETQFDAGPGLVISVEDAVVVAAKILAAERRAGFNEGAVAGMRVSREHG